VSLRLVASSRWKGGLTVRTIGLFVIKCVTFSCLRLSPVLSRKDNRGLEFPLYILHDLLHIEGLERREWSLQGGRVVGGGREER